MFHQSGAQPRPLQSRFYTKLMKIRHVGPIEPWRASCAQRRNVDHCPYQVATRNRHIALTYGYTLPDDIFGLINSLKLPSRLSKLGIRTAQQRHEARDIDVRCK